MKNFYFLFSIAFFITSCGLVNKTASSGSKALTKDQLTIKKNGVLYEKEIKDDPSSPLNYFSVSKPINIEKISSTESGWDLASFIGNVSTEYGEIQYSFFNPSQNSYMSKVEKNNIYEIKIYKDSTKFCKILNYKFLQISPASRKPIAFAVLMDHSGSMGSERANNLQEGVDSVINGKNEGDEISIFKFDNHVELVATSKDKVVLTKTVRPKQGLLNFGSATALQDAFKEGINVLTKSTIKNKQLVIITDGIENSSVKALNFEELIDSAKKNNIIVHTIGFGEWVNDEYLTKISTATGGSFQHVYNRNELKYTLQHIYNRINYNFQVSFRPCMFSDSLTVATTVKLGDKKYTHKRLFVHKINVGEIIDFQVLFEKDKAAINQDYHLQLDQLVEYLKFYPNVDLELGGHTDSDGDISYNQKLSQKRAEAIKSYLVKNGISANRLIAIGYGETLPIYPNDSDENMYLNRRTEAKIIKF